ncbi:ATP synthase F1 subunit gamma [Amphibacillus sediminis]|uniref:ATP synthase F1 subunit gamma n=1 Tax=Amphibacillus sediminis TaxID=360185 RepID=UPI00082C748D|nr:ATP synthase F1 subunit gamma [Amphibacillus sediminis]
MTPSLREIQKRINSTEKTKKITNAMHMVAASKLGKSETNNEAFIPYAEKIEEMVHHIVESYGDHQHPILIPRKVKKVAYFVVTSDRGLAGPFNSQVLRKLEELIHKRHRTSKEYTIISIGRMGRDYFKSRNMPVLRSVTDLPDHPYFSDLEDLTFDTVQFFVDGEFDQLEMVYNHFVSAVSQEVRVKKILPLVNEDDVDQLKTTKHSEFLFEPNEEQILKTLLPQYAESLIYGAFLESKASENAARMNAMRNATDNADNMISDLRLQYNRARQAQITQELSEIISGAEAQDD